MNYGLNPKQDEAVYHTEGPLLILAGAGSGKTRVLTCRMAELIREKNVDPMNLLAVTFTNKAAGEMKSRVAKMIGEGLSRAMWVATFHSACLRILRRHGEEIGYKKDFTIYDDRDQQQVIGQCLDELRMNPKTMTPKGVAHRINHAKHEGLLPQDADLDVPDFLKKQFNDLFHLYDKKMLTNQAMDFGDLIFRTLQLFKTSPSALLHYQRQFAYIHVDEYQDTNRCQYDLINLLASAHRNICVVGDDDQSIYKFRGAEIKNILDFQKDYADAHVVRLEQNYRSTGFILKAANAVVAKNKKRMSKALWTENVDGECLKLFQGLTEKDESQFVASEIQRQRDAYGYDQMAIFYRTNAQSRSLEDELRKNRIPYVIVGGMKFYDRAEIKDTMCYLKLLMNPSDSMSVKRVINTPARGIGKTTVDKVERIAALHGISLWDALTQLIEGKISAEGENEMSAATLRKLMVFIDVMADLRTKFPTMGLSDFITYLYQATGYWKMLVDENSIEAESRKENLEELVSVVTDYVHTTDEPTLEGFLDQIALASDLDKLNPEDKKISMMTFHLAKGLEFPVVFMVGMEEGLFPHERSMNFPDDLEEERRLCYVGMTRAQNFLYLSFVRQRQIFGSTQYNIPSRFLEEIPRDFVESIGPKMVAPQTQGKRIVMDEDDVRPFDDMVVRRDSPYRRGTKVRHPVFGVGEIRACEGGSTDEKLTIAFANGQLKKLLTKYANLELLA